MSQKVFNEMFNVGSSRYVVNFHDGERTNTDGSPFFAVALFTNKRIKNKFIRGLLEKGYKGQSYEEPPTATLTLPNLLETLKQSCADHLEAARQYEVQGNTGGARQLRAVANLLGVIIQGGKPATVLPFTKSDPTIYVLD